MKRIISVTLVLLLTTCLVVGCGSSSTNTTKEEPKKEDDQKKELKEALLGEWGEIIVNGNDVDIRFYVFGEDDVYYQFSHSNSFDTMITYLGYDTGTYEVTEDEIIFHQTETCAGNKDPVKEESTESYPYKFEDSMLYIGYFNGQEFRPLHKDNWQDITSELTSKTTWYAQEQIIKTEYEDYVFYR